MEGGGVDGAAGFEVADQGGGVREEGAGGGAGGGGADAVV